MTNSRRILSLDLSSSTGWAHVCGDSGVKVFKGLPGARWAQFTLWLREMHDLYPFNAVVYEKPHHRGYAATHQGHAMIGLVEWACHELSLDPPVGYHSATIKKHATGKGNATKVEMAEAAMKRAPGRKFETDDEVDALFLLDLALSDS
jgi:Holliday junction resolvasome RuvABC endonuclease subunit